MMRHARRVDTGYDWRMDALDPTGDVPSERRSSRGRALACVPDTAEDGVLIPYGLGPDDKLVHISDAPASGLACGCRCPGCRAPLEAHRGSVRVHHFKHHGDRVCTGAWETALHLLAKEIVTQASGIGLPEVAAELDGVVRVVAAARFWRCDATESEVSMGGIVPDLVLRRGDRELLVEIEVTHACDEAKREKLRERRLACVEVDLSRVPRHAPREEHAEWILRKAPRAWIFNARQAEAEAELLAAAERQRERVRRSWERTHRETLARLASAWAEPVTAGHPSWHGRLPHPSLDGRTGIDVPGDPCFTVDRATWQAAVLDLALLRARWQAFSAEAIVSHLARLEMVKPAFLRRTWDPGLLALAAERIPGLRPPQEVVRDYAGIMVQHGILRRSGRLWRGDPAWSEMATSADEKAREARARLDKLRKCLSTLLDPGPGQEEAIRQWAARPDGGRTPAAIAREGGEAWDRLSKRLDELVAMTRPGGHVLPPDEHLGLPLQVHARAREAEVKAQAEAAARWREERRLAGEAQRRKTASEFVEALVVRAEQLMGRVEGRKWAEAAFFRAAGVSLDDARQGIDEPAMDDIRALWSDEARRLGAIRRAAELKSEKLTLSSREADRCRDLLAEAATRRYAKIAGSTGITAEDRASLWLRSKQPKLGRSPREHCVDQRTLDECLDLLDPTRKVPGRW